MDKKKFNSLIKKISFDESAFEDIYKFYFPRIQLFIGRKYNDYRLGEDIAQEFFMKLGSLNIDKKIENPIAWVYKVCDNLAKDKLKKEILASEIIDNLCCESLEGNYIFHNELNEYLSQLNEKTKKIIYLVYWEGYKLKEISQIMNINYVTVRQLHSRGLKKLKKLYGWSVTKQIKK